MGTDGHTTIWNHDKIKAEATRRGGTVEQHYADGPFGYYVYPNPLGNDPKFLGVTYYADKIRYNPLAEISDPDGFYHPPELTQFIQDYNRPGGYSGNSLQQGLTGLELIQHQHFITWAYENALIAVWEVWT